MAKNIQDVFLTKLKEGQRQATVIFLNGFQSRGIITDFDHFSIQMTVDGKPQLMYKSGISTIKGG